MDTKELLKRFRDNYATAKLMLDDFDPKHAKLSNQYHHFLFAMDRVTPSELFIAFQTARIYVVSKNQLDTAELPSIKEADDLVGPGFDWTDESNLRELKYILKPFRLDEVRLPARSLYLVLEGLDIEESERSMLITRDFIILFTSLPNLIYHKGEWLSDGDYWFAGPSITIKAAIELINSQTTLRYNGLNDKAFLPARNRIFKREKIRPMEYYRVELKQKIIQKPSEQTGLIRTECNYAYDVRGHHCYRVLTGDHPLDERTERYLRKDPRRRIFQSESEIDEETHYELKKRGIQIKDNQWLAVLKYWVDPHIANLKEGKNRYIPSIKTVK